MTDQQNPPGVVINDAGTQKLLDELPGLIGAIDQSIKTTAGKPMAFIMLVFGDGVALHATNADPVVAHMALKGYCDSMEAQQNATQAVDAGAGDSQAHVPEA